MRRIVSIERRSFSASRRRFGAAGAADIRRSGSAKYRTTVGKYQIAKEGWSIVATEDLTVQAVPAIEAESRRPIRRRSRR